MIQKLPKNPESHQNVAEIYSLSPLCNPFGLFFVVVVVQLMFHSTITANPNGVIQFIVKICSSGSTFN